MRKVPFYPNDSMLFGSGITPQEYDYFQKHEGAFKRLLEDQTSQQKRKFVAAFKEFSLNHSGEEVFSLKSDSGHPFVDEVSEYLNRNFADGRLSSARGIVMDAVCLQQNNSLLQFIGSSPSAKDPFINKETRDVFRRLFGQDEGASLKAMCMLPLYVKFAGSVCRYLRRWLEAEDGEEPVVHSSPKTKRSSHSKSTRNKSDSDSWKYRRQPVSSTTLTITKDPSRDSDLTGPTVTVAVSRTGRDAFDSDEEREELEVLGSTLRKQLHLGEPHPNDAFEERYRKKKLQAKYFENRKTYEKEDEVDITDIGGKRHSCANCRKTEPRPKVFKKCQRCKGKGTRFYCSRQCQSEDWVARHRAEHL